MQKLQLKQLQRLKEEQKLKELKYTQLLKQILNNSEQLTHSVLFIRDRLKFMLMEMSNNTTANGKKQNYQNKTVNNPSYEQDFAPSSISKLVFERHLIKIKQLFDKLPDGKAKLQHFLLIMMKVLFIDPSNQLKKEKQQQILKGFVKQKNKKAKQIALKQSQVKLQQTNKENQSKKKFIPSLPKQISKRKNKESTVINSPKLTNHPQQTFNTQQIDNYPFYIMSLQYMYNEILLPSTSSITFQQLQKFIMGESISVNKIQDSNTEFKIQFEQNKVQDFLLHFCGVKKLIYCKNLNIYLCLDKKQKLVKIYSHELKYNRNYQPNTLRHNRRSPEIVDMWFVEFGNVLGLALADHTIEIINFEAFLTESYDKKFLTFPRNYIVLKMDTQIKNVYYLQMYNRWLVVGQGSQIIEVNLSKYRSKDEEIILTPFKNQKTELKVTQIIEIISLSVVCIVAGNEIWFYDEKLTRKKYNSYVHEGNISLVKFIEQRNWFYLCGQKQKFLTILKPQNKRETMDTAMITFSKPITQFEVFPMFNCILLIDDKYTLRLISEQTKQIYQTQQYIRIVKQDENKVIDQQDRKIISLLKLSNDHFMIYESYIVSLNLAKVPVETETDFEFLPYCYFDTLKQEVAVSFNNQILVISLLQAELRDTFTLENSNLQPLAYFFYSSSPQLKPFVISQTSNVYELTLKQSENITSTNDQKRYKKKLQIKNILATIFDEELYRCLVLSSNQLYVVKNDKLNTFTTLNVTNLSNFQVLTVSYVKERKCLLMNCLSTVNAKEQNPIKGTNLLSSSASFQANQSYSSSLKLQDSQKNQKQYQSLNKIQQPKQFIFQLSINDLNKYKTTTYQFQKLKLDDKPPVILKCLQISQYGIKVLLTDENVVYFIGPQQEKNERNYDAKQIPQTQRKRKSYCIKLYHFISPKVRDLLKFNEVYFFSLLISKDKSLDQNKNNNHKSTTYNCLLLTSQEGFFIELRLNFFLNKYFTKANTLKSIEKHTQTLPEICEFDFQKMFSSQFFTNQQDMFSSSQQQHSNQNIFVSKSQNVYTFHKQQEQFSLIKAHNGCKIELVQKIVIEFLFTLTVGRDGYLKLWNQEKQCIVCLKLPTLRKQIFDIKIIKQVRFQRMLQSALQVVNQISLHIDQKQSLTEILTKTRNQQLQKKYEKIDQNQPIKIDIESKDLEEMINHQEPIYSAKMVDLSASMARRFQRRYGNNTNKNAETNQKNATLQLRKKRSFSNILQKSSPKLRDSIEMPKQLLDLRRHLQKYELKTNTKQRSNQQQDRTSKTIDVSNNNNHSSSIEKPNKKISQNVNNKQLLILPKLKDYKMQTISKGFKTERQLLSVSKDLLDSQDSQYDHFQACAVVKNKRQRKKANQLDKIDKQFIRKQFSMLVKKNLAKRKDAVQILSNRVQQDKSENNDVQENKLTLETIVSDIRRIKYESKYGGERHIPKVKFKSYSHIEQ